MDSLQLEKALERERQSARGEIRIGRPVCDHVIHCANLVSTAWVVATEFTELRREDQMVIAVQRQ